MTAMVTPNGISILAMDEAVDALLNAGFTIADRGTDLSEMTVAQLKAMPEKENPQKIHAMVEAYTAHERTVQRELAFLEHIYDDRFSAKVKSGKQQEREQVIQSLVEGATHASPEIAPQMLKLVAELMSKA